MILLILLLSSSAFAMDFVDVPPGAFTMGSPFHEIGRSDDENSHKVELTKGFAIGKFEVTQKEWVEVMGRNPSRFSTSDFCPDFEKIGDAGLCPNHPVESIAWTEAQSFISKLNERNDGYHYRLPTEAEWEYAARAGTVTAYSFGDNTSLIDEFAWYMGNSGNKTHKVGKKKPNGYGIHDMHGNVWELTSDWYGRYDMDGRVDPRGPDNGIARVLRGGSWYIGLEYLRSAQRNQILQGTSHSDVGFRLIRELR